MGAGGTAGSAAPPLGSSVPCQRRALLPPPPRRPPGAPSRATRWLPAACLAGGIVRLGPGHGEEAFFAKHEDHNKQNSFVGTSLQEQEREEGWIL